MSECTTREVIGLRQSEPQTDPPALTLSHWSPRASSYAHVASGHVPSTNLSARNLVQLSQYSWSTDASVDQPFFSSSRKMFCEISVCWGVVVRPNLSNLILNLQT